MNDLSSSKPGGSTSGGVSGAGGGSLTPAMRDFTAAMHIKELAFADIAEPELRFAEESQS